ncbi:MAG TPA: ABC transporter permease [Gemmatimonadales bacterium]|jgi:spermidine/putrescine transport system permease protein|nr:ABC transporter permease [Gemmatimonadales bacterium]
MAGTAAGGSRRSRLAPYLLIAPGILWLLVFFVVPIVTLAQTSVHVVDAPWWDGYYRALNNYGVHFFRSFRYALIATLLALALGYPLAYVIAFRAGRFKNLLLGLVVLPFFTTFLVRTFAWKTILNDEGPAAWLLRRMHLLAEGGRLLDTTLAVVGGLTYNFLPFMILPIYVSLEKIDRRLVEAAEDLYSTPIGAFRKVVLPLSLPGVFAGSLLTFIPAAGDFINAQLLGSPNQQMIGTIIQNQFLAVRDYPLAAALSFVLMLIITLGVLAYARVLGTEELA